MFVSLHSFSRAVFVLALCAAQLFAQQRAGSIRGQVADELGALVVGATVTLTLADGSQKNTTSASDGSYNFTGVVPGKYSIRVVAPGFGLYENTEVVVTAGTRTTNDVKLAVALESQVVNITSEPTLNTDPANNADALVLKGQDIDVLPDDPDALASAVQAMAGPSAGPNGGQIFVDGFTGGRMPPKESIREVRVNQNPFNAENSGIGFGRVDILTKPGMDKLRGSSFFNFGDESFNSRNPFAPSRTPFQIRYFGGSLSGPIIAKKASFFVDVSQRVTDDNAIINATVLDSSLEPTRFNSGLLVPSRNFSISPRFDYQLGTNHTFVVRYSYNRSSAENVGASDFSLPERAFDRANTQQTLQITETAILSPAMLNETRIQFIRNRSEQNGNNSIPTVTVQESFIAGGSQVGQAFTNDNRWEVQNYTTWTKGEHILRFGGRIGGVRLTDHSPQNFGGSYTFSGGDAPALDANDNLVLVNGNPVIVSITSLERYRRTLLFQNTPNLRALGGGVTQFSVAGGNPEAKVKQIDMGLFIQDEWRMRPNFTLTLGLRYERQTNISSNLNFAPRIFFAWAPGGTSVGGGPGAPSNSSSPKMVIRGGFGFFYDRLGERATLLENRFNGVNQQDFRVFNENVLDISKFSQDGSVTNVLTSDILAGFSAPQIIRRVADDFQAPTFMMTAINFERQLPSNFTFFAVAFNYRGKHLLRVRNINAPLPGTYDPSNPSSAVRPFGRPGDIYYYESSASFNDYRFFGGLRRQMSKGFSVFANYGFGRGKTDTDCIFGTIASCFPADSYDVSNEYSRVGFIPTGNFFVGGTLILPKLKLNLNPFIIISSGRPFNIVTGRDTNGDGVFLERPAFATSATALADLKRTKYGDFDLNPAPGQALIPRNYGMGPGFFSVNLGISRSITFGNIPGSSVAAAVAPGPAPAGATRQPAGSSATSQPANSSNAQAKPSNAPSPEKRYNVTFSINIQNLLNRSNLGQPVGNLSSPSFGESTNTTGSFGFGPGGSAAAGNRRIQAQVRFSF